MSELIRKQASGNKASASVNDLDEFRYWVKTVRGYPLTSVGCKLFSRAGSLWSPQR